MKQAFRTHDDFQTWMCQNCREWEGAICTGGGCYEMDTANHVSLNWLNEAFARHKGDPVAINKALKRKRVSIARGK